MTIYKEDIVCIGDYPEMSMDGNLDIKALYPITNSDEILLREILLKFGEYRITEIIILEDSVCFRTNLPFDLYKEALNEYRMINGRKGFR